MIIEIKDNGDYEFLELRKNTPTCQVGGHDDSSFSRTLEIISDCEAVLVSQIGPGATNSLIFHGIQPLIMPMFIDDALKQLASSNKNSSGN